MAPDLKFSATTSKWGTSWRNSSRPRSVLMSRPTLRLLRLLRRNVAPTRRPWGSSIAGRAPRPDSPCAGCSIFTTSAPRRAISWVPNGSACICSAASTRMPSSGLPCRCASAFATSPSFIADHAASWVQPRCRLQSSAVRGIISAGGYVPYRRLDRSEIAAFFGTGGGRGTRSVAAYDEDTTTMGVEAARFALRSAPEVTGPGALWFATANPAYLEKTNANAVHAALRLDRSTPAIDTGGAVRSGVGSLRAALDSRAPVLVVTADVRGGLPTGADEAAGSDGASALLVGDDAAGPVIAELLGAASATEEFVDRWRTPGDANAK